MIDDHDEPPTHEEMMEYIRTHKMEAFLRMIWLLPHLVIQFFIGFVGSIRDELERRRR